MTQIIKIGLNHGSQEEKIPKLMKILARLSDQCQKRANDQSCHKIDVEILSK